MCGRHVYYHHIAIISLFFIWNIGWLCVLCEYDNRLGNYSLSRVHNFQIIFVLMRVVPYLPILMFFILIKMFGYNRGECKCVRLYMYI